MSDKDQQDRRLREIYPDLFKEAPSPLVAPAVELPRPPMVPVGAPANPNPNALVMRALEERVPPFSPLKGEYCRLHVDEDKGAQHNPSVFTWGSELWAVVRCLHAHHTINYLCRLSDGRVSSAHKIIRTTPQGELEDLRPFLWNGDLWAIAATHHAAYAIRQVLIRLGDRGTILEHHVQPSDRHEKNWMPCLVPSVEGKEERLRLVYSLDPLRVLDVGGERRQANPSAVAMAKVGSYWRGGSQLVALKGEEGGFLAVVHRVYKPPRYANHNPCLDGWPTFQPDPVSGTAPVVYVHHFARFDAALSSVTLSKPWYFRAVGVEFGCGLALHEGRLVASFGVADKEAWTVTLPVEDALALFEQ